MAGSEQLTRRQEKALLALLTSPSVAEAARAAGIGERTLWRWFQQEPFARRYRELRRQSVAQAVARLQRSAGVAVETLEAVMTDKQAPAAARVRAAVATLELAVRGAELEELSARVAALEDAVKRGGVSLYA